MVNQIRKNNPKRSYTMDITGGESIAQKKFELLLKTLNEIDSHVMLAMAVDPIHGGKIILNN